MLIVEGSISSCEGGGEFKIIVDDSDGYLVSMRNEYLIGSGLLVNGINSRIRADLYDVISLTQ